MTFEEYQKKARETAVYPEALGHNYVYPTLGLVGEAGEVAEKIKKILRDKGGILDEEAIAGLHKELGDVLWYLATLATELGLSLGDVAEGNLIKLQIRKVWGVLRGAGDNR
jgi:NTP pyrophosphatase (non-canonical NTP hydrolase)